MQRFWKSPLVGAGKVYDTKFRNALIKGRQGLFEINMQSIKIKKGFDIPMAGAPEQKIDSSYSVDQVALVATDFIGLKPKMLVREGQTVGLGEPLMIDKHDEQI